jgi:hypothetical protein
MGLFKNQFSSIIVIGVSALFFSTGCHSYMLDDAQNDLRNSFSNGDFESTAQMLRSLEDRNVYKAKDEVIWNLENGMIFRFAGKYDSSTVYLSRAENAIEDNYTKSISRGFLSLIGNDNNLVYDGEPYEDIYLNAFKALNFIHQEDWEAALVETRRMTFKMEQLDIRMKGLAEAFAKTDTTGDIEWESGTANIQNSAMSHYLASILFAKTNRPDNARIEFDRLDRALKEQATLGNYEPFDSQQLAQIVRPETYNVLLTGFSGQAPIKYQDDVRLWGEGSNGAYVKFSLPDIELYPTQVQRVRVVLNNRKEIDLHLIEEMDLVAKEVYSAKQPVIYARSLLRALMKAGGTSILENAAEDQSRGLGFAAKVLNLLYKETSEKADLRGWQTLPGQAWMNVVQLPTGRSTVRIEYLSRSGRVIYAEENTVDISEQTQLELIESIYAN